MSFVEKIKFAVSYFKSSRMSFYGLRLEYALDGNLNYIASKDHMEAVLEDNGLKEFIDQEVPKPIATNAQEFAE